MIYNYYNLLENSHNRSIKVLNQIVFTREYSVNNNKKSSKNSRNKEKKKLQLKRKDVIHFLQWIGMTYGIADYNLINFYPFLETLFHYEKHKGIKFTINIIKEVRVALENYFCNSNEKKNYKYIRLNYLGIPVILSKAIYYLKLKELKYKILVLSLLTIGRSAKFRKDPDYSSITDVGHMVREVPKSIFLGFISFLKDKSSVKRFKIPIFERYHFSIKSSPLGENSMESCMVELAALPQTIRETIYKIGGRDMKFRIEFLISNFKIITQFLQGFSGCIDKLISNFKVNSDFIYPTDIHDINDPFYGYLSHYLRKLVSFAEFEGKTRIIGLSDYWTQCALEPIASVFFKILTTINQDQTFDQAEGCKELTFNSHRLYFSFDLSSFTDRFPMKVVSSLLKYMYNDEFSENISYILSGIPFWRPDEKDFISYSVGNPMGTKASWALTTLSHHLIIYWACKNINIDFDTAPYKMLGDDIVIWDEILAEEYSKLIRSIGVNISSYKTIIAKGGFSFAKRLFTSLGEISPISFRLWYQSLKDFPMMIELINLCKDRSNCLLQSNANMLKVTLEFSLKLYPIRKKRMKMFFKKNFLLLLDLVIKKDNLIGSVRYIIDTYTRHNRGLFIPWPLLREYENILREIMLTKIKKHIMEFNGLIPIHDQNNDPESDETIFFREKLIAFELFDFDEFNDLLNICVPHLFINENIINRQVYDIILSLSNDTVVPKSILDQWTGLNILNYNRIKRETTKELSPVSKRNIEFSKLMINTINQFKSTIDQVSFSSRINTLPLMVIDIDDRSLSLYNDTK